VRSLPLKSSRKKKSEIRQRREDQDCVPSADQVLRPLTRDERRVRTGFVARRVRRDWVAGVRALDIDRKVRIFQDKLKIQKGLVTQEVRETEGVRIRDVKMIGIVVQVRTSFFRGEVHHLAREVEVPPITLVRGVRSKIFGVLTVLPVRSVT